MSCYVCIEQSEVGIKESCGEFTGTLDPGCNILVPCRDAVAGRVSLRVTEMNVNVESKTKDNVFIHLAVSLQFQVLKQSVRESFYMLEQAEKQIEAYGGKTQRLALTHSLTHLHSYVHNSIRGQIPKFDVDQIYLMRSEISATLKEELDHQMSQYGYEIINALVADIEPARSVADAMNAIQTYQRLRTATVDKAEAAKIQVVKAAEANAEAMRLSGVGLAEQRKAIVAGLQTSIEQFQQGVPGLGSDDVMSLLLLNQVRNQRK